MITLPVEQDDEGYFLTFTDDLLEQLGWKAGDVLNWDEQDDGSIRVSKYVETDDQDHAVCDI